MGRSFGDTLMQSSQCVIFIWENGLKEIVSVILRYIQETEVLHFIPSCILKDEINFLCLHSFHFL